WLPAGLVTARRRRKHASRDERDGPRARAIPDAERVVDEVHRIAQVGESGLALRPLPRERIAFVPRLVGQRERHLAGGPGRPAAGPGRRLAQSAGGWRAGRRLSVAREARLDVAGRPTTVTVGEVPVVALLACIDVRVPARRRDVP